MLRVMLDNESGNTASLVEDLTMRQRSTDTGPPEYGEGDTTP